LLHGLLGVFRAALSVRWSIVSGAGERILALKRLTQQLVMKKNFGTRSVVLADLQTGSFRHFLTFPDLSSPDNLRRERQSGGHYR
jgi:hypothetical protein